MMIPDMRVPPQAVYAERAVLVIAFHNNETIPKILRALGKDKDGTPGKALYMGKFAKVFCAMVSLFGKKTPIDLITLVDELRKSGSYEEIGGIDSLKEMLLEKQPEKEIVGFSAENLDHYLKIILEKYLFRRIIDAAQKALRSAYEEDIEKPENLKRGLSRLISEIAKLETKTAHN